MFSIQCWFGPLSLTNKNKLSRIIKQGEKIANSIFKDLKELHDGQAENLAIKIISDPSHILCTCFELLPSGRRYIVPICKSKRYKMSFVPLSISLLNH